MEYCLVIKNNEVLPIAATWTDLEGIMLSEMCQTEKDKYYIISLYVQSKKQNEQTNRNKLMNTENNLMFWWAALGKR